MRRTCAVCEKPFEAQRATAKYCGPRCRLVAKRRRSDSGGADATESSELVAAIRKELGKLRQLDTVEGQLAIELAIKITTPGMTGVAGLSKELLSVRAQIRSLAAPPAPTGPVPGDQVTDLRKRRDAKKARQAAHRA